MSPRVSASVEIFLGTISVHVKLYAVASESSVSLTQVHEACGTRLKQQYVCPTDGSVVPREGTARQYPLPDGRVATLTPEDLRTVWSDSPDRVHTIDILECIPEGSIDPIYLGKAMFVGPPEEGHDLYSELINALATTRTAAVGMRYGLSRDQLVLLQPYRERGLLLRELFYASEVHALDELLLPASQDVAILPERVRILTKEIEQRRKSTFGAGAYEDSYPARLRQLAERKASEGAPGAGASRPATLEKPGRQRAAKGAAPRVKPEPRGPAEVHALPVVRTAKREEMETEKKATTTP